MKFKKIVSTWLHSSNLEKTKEFMENLGLSTTAETENLVIFTYPEGGPNTAYYLYPEPLNYPSIEIEEPIYHITLEVLLNWKRRRYFSMSQLDQSV